MNGGQRKQKDGEEGEFGGKERRRITNSVSMTFAGQGESNSRFHSPLINHHLIILKRKKIKSSLCETQISLSLLLPLSENPPHVSPANWLPPNPYYTPSRNRKLYFPKSSSLGQSSMSLRALASFCFSTSLRSSHSVSSSWPWA